MEEINSIYNADDNDESDEDDEKVSNAITDPTMIMEYRMKLLR